MSGSITNVNDSPVTNAAGAVTFTKGSAKNYTVKEHNGQLTMTAPSITDTARFTVSDPEDTVYNGTEQKQPVTIHDATTGKDLGEADYTLTYTEDRTNVGTVTVTVTGQGNYAGTVEKTYEITAAPLDITANSQNFTYDGNAHSDNGWTLTNGTKLFGEDAITVAVSGSITNVNDSPVTNAAGAVTFTKGSAKNYTVKEHNGQLTMIKASADLNKVSATPYIGLYDGIEHSIDATSLINDGTTTLYYTLEKPQNVVLNAVLNLFGAETTDNRVWTTTKPTFTDATTAQTVYVKAVNPNYEDAYGQATVTINKRNVTLTSGSGAKEYDGTALTNHNVAVSGDGFVTGESAAYNVTGTQTESGYSANTFTYAMNDGTNAANYNVTTVNGTLLVRPVTPETPDRPETPETPTRPTTPSTTTNARPSTPNTGDQTNVPFAAGVMSISMLLAAVAILMKRKYSE